MVLGIKPSETPNPDREMARTSKTGGAEDSQGKVDNPVCSKLEVSTQRVWFYLAGK